MFGTLPVVVAYRKDREECERRGVFDDSKGENVAQVERDTDWIAKALVKYDIELWERDDDLRSLVWSII